MLIKCDFNCKTPSYILFFLLFFIFPTIHSFSQPPVLAVSQYPYIESFEYVYANWVQDDADDFDWSVNIAMTPVDGTGPFAAYDGNCYLYTRAAENYPGKQAYIISPAMDIDHLDDPMLAFAYHMYGEDMGRLEVWVSFDNGETWSEKICYFEGNKGERWYVANIDLRRFRGKMLRFRFTGITGDGEHGDLALDYVFVGEREQFAYRDEPIVPHSYNVDADVIFDGTNLMVKLPEDLVSRTSLSVYNVSGQQVIDYGLCLNDDIYLNTEGFEEGIYFVRLHHEGITKTKKVYLRE